MTSPNLVKMISKVFVNCLIQVKNKIFFKFSKNIFQTKNLLSKLFANIHFEKLENQIFQNSEPYYVHTVV